MNRHNILLALLLALCLGLGAAAQPKPQKQPDGKWGYADAAGQLVVKARYDQARPFSNGFAAVAQDGKWGYIDTEGRHTVKCQYGSAADFSGGYAIVSDRKSGLFGAVNTDGDLIVVCEHDSPDGVTQVLRAVIKR